MLISSGIGGVSLSECKIPDACAPQIVNALRFGCTPVGVLDGEAPEAKLETLQKRWIGMCQSWRIYIATCQPWRAPFCYVSACPALGAAQHTAGYDRRVVIQISAICADSKSATMLRAAAAAMRSSSACVALSRTFSWPWCKVPPSSIVLMDPPACCS